jgi:hypothetical protein
VKVSIVSFRNISTFLATAPSAATFSEIRIERLSPPPFSLYAKISPLLRFAFQL